MDENKKPFIPFDTWRGDKVIESFTGQALEEFLMNGIDDYLSKKQLVYPIAILISEKNKTVSIIPTVMLANHAEGLGSIAYQLEADRLVTVDNVKCTDTLVPEGIMKIKRGTQCVIITRVDYRAINEGTVSIIPVISDEDKSYLDIDESHWHVGSIIHSSLYAQYLKTSKPLPDSTLLAN